MEYLRKCQWNYGTAKTLYYAPATLADFADRLASMDWTELLQKVADSIQAMTERIVEIVQSDEFQAACRAVIAEKTKKGGDGNELATGIAHNDAIKKPDDDASKKMWSNKLVPVGFSEHDCESHYKCPFCGEPYRSWSMTIGKVFACNKCGRDVWTN